MRFEDIDGLSSTCGVFQAGRTVKYYGDQRFAEKSEVVAWFTRTY